MKRRLTAPATTARPARTGSCRRQFPAQIAERDRFHPVGEREPLDAAVHDQATLRSHGLAGQMKAPLDLGREPPLDLDGPGVAVAG